MATDEVASTKLNIVWRIIDKFKQSVFQLGLNVYDFFKPFDPHGEGLISQYNFRKVCLVLLKDYVPLSETEVRSLIDFFCYRDGRIFWQDLCDRIHDRMEPCGNVDYVTGNEWDDPRTRNALPIDKETKLNILLENISANLTMNDIPIDIHFKEYEQVAQNPGCVSWEHLHRIFIAMRVRITQEDFNLLVKRYGRHNFLFNYVPFLEDLSEATKNLAKKTGGKVWTDTRYYINTQPDKNVRPDLKANWKERGLCQGKPISHRLLGAYPFTEEGPLMTMRRIKLHSLVNGINFRTLFLFFDPNNFGEVNTNDFLRTLSNAGINCGVNSRLHLEDSDISTLIQIYSKPNTEDSIMWKLFVADIEEGLAKRTLTSKIKDDFSDLHYVPAQGNVWSQTSPEVREHCEDVIMRLRAILKCRGVDLKQFFEPFDKGGNGYIDIFAFREVLNTQKLLDASEDFDALEKRYTCAYGFDYLQLIDELRMEEQFRPPVPPAQPPSKVDGDPCIEKMPTSEEFSRALLNIRRKCVINSAYPAQFMRQFDPNSRQLLSASDFARALSMANIFTTKEDVDILCKLFKAPISGEIEYQRFLTAMSEAYTQGGLEKTPLLVPVTHVPVIDPPFRALNYDQRRLVAQAIDILSEHLHMMHYDDFKHYDKSGAGDLFMNQFNKLLDFFKIKLTSDQTDALFQAFGRKNVNTLCLEYLPLLRILDCHHRDKREV